jgi:hypothetical protein
MAGMSLESVNWVRLLGGFVFLYAVLQGTATALNSTFGQGGVIVLAIATRELAQTGLGQADAARRGRWRRD